MGLFSFGRKETATISKTVKKKAAKRTAPNLIQVRVTKAEKIKLAKWVKANETTVSKTIRSIIKELK